MCECLPLKAPLDKYVGHSSRSTEKTLLVVQLALKSPLTLCQCAGCPSPNATFLLANSENPEGYVQLIGKYPELRFAVGSSSSPKEV